MGNRLAIRMCELGVIIDEMFCGLLAGLSLAKKDLANPSTLIVPRLSTIALGQNTNSDSSFPVIKLTKVDASNMISTSGFGAIPS